MSDTVNPDIRKLVTHADDIVAGVREHCERAASRFVAPAVVTGNVEIDMTYSTPELVLSIELADRSGYQDWCNVVNVGVEAGSWWVEHAARRVGDSRLYLEPGETVALVAWRELAAKAKRLEVLQP